MHFRQIHILLFLFIQINNSTFAQNSIHLIPESSSIRVFGTSNIHDWEMHVEFQAKTSDYEIPGNSLKNLKNTQFKIEGIRLKSNENAMEKRLTKLLICLNSRS